MKLYFREMGHGMPFVMTHGYLGMGDNLLTIGKAMSQTHHVYLLDLRNHGHSFHHKEMTYRSIIGDIKHFLDSENIQKCHLMGHSMGGKMMMYFSSLYPERVEKMLIVDISPRTYEDNYSKAVEHLMTLDIGGHLSRRQIDESLSKYIKKPTIRGFMLKNLVWSEQKKAYYWRCNLRALYDAMGGIIQFPEIPDGMPTKVCFVYGGKSRYITEEDKKLILRKFPKAIFVKIPDAGHWVHSQKPEAFIDAVKGFMLGY